MHSFALHFRHPARAVLAGALGLACAQAQAGEFRFGGKVFADASYQTQTDHVSHTDSSNTNADLKRAYLDFDYRFNQVWSMQLTTDINWLRDQPVSDLWVRHLYAQRQYAGGSVLRLGVADMPMLSLTSKWYGFRYVDSLGSSMAKIDSAADWGAHLTTPLTASIDAAVSVVSGGGYKDPAVGDRPDVEALLAWQPTRQSILAVGGYDGQLAAQSSASLPIRHTARRADLLAAWADADWRLGMRYAWASNWGRQFSVADDRARNWSGWASRRIAPRWTAFARLDLTQPSVLLDSGRRNRYANLGVEWKLRDWLKLAFVAKRSEQRRGDTLLRSGNELGVWSETKF